MYKYKFLEDEAIADVVFVIEASTLNELFKGCGEACFEVMVKLEDVEAKNTREFEVEEDDLESLLYGYLSELVYLKDRDGMVFREFEVKVDEKALKLKCKVKGEMINMNKHELRGDVKAVTYHDFRIWKEKSKWKAKVLLDV